MCFTQCLSDGLTWWESRDSSTGRKPWWKPIISSRWLGFCQPVRKTHGETELASLLFKVETWGSIRHYQTIHLPIWLFTSLLCTKVGEVESLWRHDVMLRCHGVTDARWFPTLWAKSFNFLRLNWCVMESWWGFPNWLGMGAPMVRVTPPWDENVAQLSKGR